MTTVVVPSFDASAASAGSIIDRAYSLLGHKAAGEPLSGDDADYALGVLNGLIDSWNTQRLFIVTVSEVVATVSGVSATIGTGQQFDIGRPIDVETGAFARLAGIDYPIEWIDRVTYERLTLKTVSSTFPQYAYYNQDLQIGTIYFYPAPSAAIEVHIPLQVQLDAFADQSTKYVLAPGYKRALEYTLAEELAPGLRPIDPQIVRTAQIARRAIRRTNVDVPLMNPDLRNVRFNVYSGL